MLSKQEIADECRELYEEIRDLQEYFGWTQKGLCEKTFGPIYDRSIDAGLDDERGYKKSLGKWQERIKKTFQRKTWEQNKATGKVLADLEKLRDAIYLTDEYRYSDLHESRLTLKLRKGIAKATKPLKEWLKKHDYEE